VSAVRTLDAVPRAGIDPRWLARRRWARAGLIYFLLILFSFVFMGPLVLGFVSSLKTDPLEYPPRLAFEQVNPRNWTSAWRLGVAGAGDGLLGGFAPGADLRLRLAYVVPDGQAAEAPRLTVPRRRPGAGLGVVLQQDYAADYAVVSPAREVARIPATTAGGQPAQKVTYEFTVTYPADAKNATDPSQPAPRLDRVPLDVEVPSGQVYSSGTLDPSRFERRGRVQSWDNLAPGAIGYVFRNYVRAFTESRSVTTGQGLFLRWVLNSFLLVGLKIASTIVLASMAGYALARLRFPGRTQLFLFIIFTMTIPAQVTFISNYLVLKDGIWGFSRLWGQATLLNSVIGVWFVTGIVGAAAVFLMKQFFETLPRELEEAAKIDGASILQTFTRVMLPLAGPALGALTITTAQGAWNEYFWALVVLTTPVDNYTLPIGLSSFNKQYGQVGDYGLILAGAILSAIPVIILFIVFQKYFVQGVAYSGGKE
jgi:multiple sugar transport system permease protein